MQEFQLDVRDNKRIRTWGCVAIAAKLGQIAGEISEDIHGIAAIDGSVQEYEQISTTRQCRTNAATYCKYFKLK